MIVGAARAMKMRISLLALAGVLATGQVTAATPYFSDSLEWASASDAIKNGPWSRVEGDATISTQHAHSGSKSLKVCYHANEQISYLGFQNPKDKSRIGAKNIILGWWEYRPADYDWSGEKFNRVSGLFPNGNVTLDYPLGWVADGGWGQPGTNGPGEIQMFGNSVYSNGKNHFSVVYKMPRQQWHYFEYEINLNDVGVSNGSASLRVDNQLLAQKTNIELRYDNTHTLDVVHMGGWYSGGNNPEPSPACRYIDDVTLTFTKSGTAPPNPPVPQ